MQVVELLRAPEAIAAQVDGVTIEKAFPDDFERVYPLFEDFGISRLTRNHWHRLFTKNWDSTEDYCGYLLEQRGEVKGFLGLIFSERPINGGREKFCNMPSWTVKQEARG